MTYIKKRIQKKVSKEPDEVLTLYQRGVDWANENVKVLTLAGGTIILIAVLSLGYIWVHNSRQESANQALSAAINLYRQSTSFKAGELSGGVDQSADDSLKRALAAFQGVASEYQSMKQGKEASLFAANLYFRMGSYEQAAAEVESLLERDPEFSQQLNVSYFMARILEAKGNYSRAVDLYTGVLVSATTDLKPVVMMDLARCYELSGDKDQAIENYKLVLSEFQDTVYANKAEAKLATFGIKSDDLP